MGSTVLAPHPVFRERFAPGIVTSYSVDSQSADCCVEFYNGLEVCCIHCGNNYYTLAVIIKVVCVDQVTSAIAELVFLSPARHEMAVRLLQEREREWVGRAVVARRDDDGVYYPGWLTFSTMESNNNNANCFSGGD